MPVYAYNHEKNHKRKVYNNRIKLSEEIKSAEKISKSNNHDNNDDNNKSSNNKTTTIM